LSSLDITQYLNLIIQNKNISSPRERDCNTERLLCVCCRKPDLLPVTCCTCYV